MESATLTSLRQQLATEEGGLKAILPLRDLAPDQIDVKIAAHRAAIARLENEITAQKAADRKQAILAFTGASYDNDDATSSNTTMASTSSRRKENNPLGETTFSYAKHADIELMEGVRTPAKEEGVIKFLVDIARIPIVMSYPNPLQTAVLMTEFCAYGHIGGNGNITPTSELPFEIELDTQDATGFSIASLEKTKGAKDQYDGAHLVSELPMASLKMLYEIIADYKQLIRKGNKGVLEVISETNVYEVYKKWMEAYTNANIHIKVINANTAELDERFAWYKKRADARRIVTKYNAAVERRAAKGSNKPIGLDVPTAEMVEMHKEDSKVYPDAPILDHWLDDITVIEFAESFDKIFPPGYGDTNEEEAARNKPNMPYSPGDDDLRRLRTACREYAAEVRREATQSIKSKYPLLFAFKRVITLIKKTTKFVEYQMCAKLPSTLPAISDKYRKEQDSDSAVGDAIFLQECMRQFSQFFRRDKPKKKTNMALSFSELAHMFADPTQFSKMVSKDNIRDNTFIFIDDAPSRGGAFFGDVASSIESAEKERQRREKTKADRRAELHRELETISLTMPEKEAPDILFTRLMNMWLDMKRLYFDYVVNRDYRDESLFLAFCLYPRDVYSETEVERSVRYTVCPKRVAGNIRMDTEPPDPLVGLTNIEAFNTELAERCMRLPQLPATKKDLLFMHGMGLLNSNEGVGIFNTHEIADMEHDEMASMMSGTTASSALSTMEAVNRDCDAMPFSMDDLLSMTGLGYSIGLAPTAHEGRNRGEFRPMDKHEKRKLRTAEYKKRRKSIIMFAENCRRLATIILHRIRFAGSDSNGEGVLRSLIPKTMELFAMFSRSASHIEDTVRPVDMYEPIFGFGTSDALELVSPLRGRFKADMVRLFERDGLKATMVGALDLCRIRPGYIYLSIDKIDSTKSSGYMMESNDTETLYRDMLSMMTTSIASAIFDITERTTTKQKRSLESYLSSLVSSVDKLNDDDQKDADLIFGQFDFIPLAVGSEEDKKALFQSPGCSHRYMLEKYCKNDIRDKIKHDADTTNANRITYIAQLARFECARDQKRVPSVTEIVASMSYDVFGIAILKGTQLKNRLAIDVDEIEGTDGARNQIIQKDDKIYIEHAARKLRQEYIAFVRQQIRSGRLKEVYDITYPRGTSRFDFSAVNSIADERTMRVKMSKRLRKADKSKEYARIINKDGEQIPVSGKEMMFILSEQVIDDLENGRDFTVSIKDDDFEPSTHASEFANEIFFNKRQGAQRLNTIAEEDRAPVVMPPGMGMDDYEPPRRIIPQVKQPTVAAAASSKREADGIDEDAPIARRTIPKKQHVAKFAPVMPRMSGGDDEDEPPLARLLSDRKKTSLHLDTSQESQKRSLLDKPAHEAEPVSMKPSSMKKQPPCTSANEWNSEKRQRVSTPPPQPKKKNVGFRFNAEPSSGSGADPNDMQTGARPRRDDVDDLADHTANLSLKPTRIY